MCRRRARTLELEQAEQQAALGKQTQQPSTLELLAAVSAASAAPTAALDLEGSIPRILPAPTNAALNTSSSDTDSLPAAENETSASGQEALTGAPVAKVRMYLVNLKYWTLNLMPPMVYPEVLFPLNSSIKHRCRQQLDALGEKLAARPRRAGSPQFRPELQGADHCQGNAVRP